MPVGQILHDHRAVCAYSGDDPVGPVCAAPATHHILALDRTYGAVGLATCADHYANALRACPYLTEHTYAGFCGLPATRWDLVHNRCVLNANGREPARAHHDLYERAAS